MLTEYGLDQLAAVVHESAVEKGFWSQGTTDISYDTMGNKLALVHSEVTEVLEAIRKNQGEKAIVTEMADIIIRLVDLYAAMRNAGLITHSIDDIIEEKVEINKNRPHKHGNNF